MSVVMWGVIATPQWRKYYVWGTSFSSFEVKIGKQIY